MTPEQLQNYSKTNTNLTSFLSRTIPSFVTGEKDPNSDVDWNALVNAINKYNPNAVTQDLQTLLQIPYDRTERENKEHEHQSAIDKEVRNIV